ncbi:MAG: class I SAM-dependent methyltransferase [Pyrinomonadaceae bacterium]
MQRYYQDDDYFEGGESGYSDSSYSDQEQALKATFRCLMRNLEKRGMTGGSLLEIGCGYGYLLAEARDHFETLVGTDFSPEGARRSREFGDEVFEGGVESLPDGLKFDCIIATHVIEHVYDPVHFVKALIQHANPGAVIVLAAPDMGGMLRKVMGSRWASFKLPEHVLYFNATTLGTVMRTAGIIEPALFPYPHAFPISLIASKFHLPVPKFVGQMNVWVPATTVALYGRISNGES